MVDIHPIERQSIAEEAAARLRSLILSGELKAGAKLPSERELAARFGTNRNTLREALRTLEALGLVAVRQGAPSEVLDFRQSGNLALIPYFMKEVGFGPGLAAVVRDLYALRRDFIVHMARAAAARASRADLEQVEEIAGRIGSERAEARRVAALDIDFYNALVRATGNPVNRWIYNTFVPIFDFIVEHMPAEWSFPADYFAGIARVARAVTAGRPEAAARAVRAHLTKTDETVFALLDAIVKRKGRTR